MQEAVQELGSSIFYRAEDGVRAGVASRGLGNMYKGQISTLIMTTLLRQGTANGFFKLGLTLILGGAIGNIIDRVSQGYVMDFVDLHWQAWHWPAFNVADAGITMGALVVLLDVFGSMRTIPRAH